jgi:hypothetical protein
MYRPNNTAVYFPSFIMGNVFFTPTHRYEVLSEWGWAIWLEGRRCFPRTIVQHVVRDCTIPDYHRDVSAIAKWPTLFAMRPPCCLTSLRHLNSATLLPVEQKYSALALLKTSFIKHFTMKNIKDTITRNKWETHSTEILRAEWRVW